GVFAPTPAGGRGPVTRGGRPLPPLPHEAGRGLYGRPRRTVNGPRERHGRAPDPSRSARTRRAGGGAGQRLAGAEHELVHVVGAPGIPVADRIEVGERAEVPAGEERADRVQLPQG